MDAYYSFSSSFNMIVVYSVLSFLLFLNLLVVFAPVKIAFADYNFGAAGDWGCSSNTRNIENGIVAKKPERVLGLGDYSYQPTATCWLNIIKPTDSITKIAIGNHEDDDNEDYQKYISHFGLTNPYYSFNYNNVHVLVMDTDRTSFSSGSSQFKFVQSDLKAASQNPSINWIVVTFHKPIYTSPNACSSCEPSSTLRNTYHPMFDQYGVDLVLQGHVHNYQRTFPLKYNPSSPSSPTKTSSSTSSYNNPEGEIFAIVGTGGINFHSLSGKSSFVASQQDKRFGYMNIVFTNDRTTMQAKYYLDSGSVSDQFTIKKTIGNSAPIANSQSVTVIKNTPKAIALTASDANRDTLTYSVVSQSTHGTLSGTAPSLTYTPDTDYVGSDSFTFKVNDGAADSNTATVSMTVNPSSDTTKPTVIGTSPGGGTSNIQVNSVIKVTFSEPMLASSVSIDTFTLRIADTPTTLGGTVSLSSDGRTATFDPSANLDTSTRYVATIFTGATDLAGNALSESKKWSFTTATTATATTTAAQSDMTPPTVVNTNPSGGATGVAVTSSIAISFSEAVQSSTVSTSTFTLKTGTTNIAGAVSLSADGKTATFDPSSSLMDSTTYTATVTTGVEDLAENAMTSVKTWSFTTAAGTPPPAPPPSSSCNSNLVLTGSKSSASRNSFPPDNAIDNSPNTKWWSTFSADPWIRVDLGEPKSICSINVAWDDGNSRQYSFTVSVSADDSSFTNVFSGKSKGTTTSPEKYSFAESQARYVKITITQSHAGSTRSIAQISEIDIFGKASASASSKQLSSSSQSLSQQEKLASNTASSIPVGPSLSLNKPPVAKDDGMKTEINKPVGIAILRNDNDPDGDKLKMISVTSPTQKGGIVVINLNGTVTFFPRVDYTGTDRFSYTISDGEGNSDKAKVSVTVNAPPPPTGRTADKQSSPSIQGNQDGGGVNLQQKNQADNKLAIEMTDRQAFQTGRGVNDTGNNIR
jgi:hypothetical protein